MNSRASVRRRRTRRVRRQSGDRSTPSPRSPHATKLATHTSFGSVDADGDTGDNVGDDADNFDVGDPSFMKAGSTGDDVGDNACMAHAHNTGDDIGDDADSFDVGDPGFVNAGCTGDDVGDDACIAQVRNTGDDIGDDADLFDVGDPGFVFAGCTGDYAGVDAGIRSAGDTGGVDVGDDADMFDVGDPSFGNAGSTDDDVGDDDRIAHARNTGDDIGVDADSFDVGDPGFVHAGCTGVDVGDYADRFEVGDPGFVDAGRTGDYVGEDAGLVSAGGTGDDVGDDAGTAEAVVVVVPEIGDGHCMFRAFARQLRNDPEQYQDMRRLCCRQLRSPTARSRYAATLGGEGPSGQLRALRARTQRVAQGAWGDHLELQALADTLGVEARIWRRDGDECFVQHSAVVPSAGVALSRRVIQLLYNVRAGTADGDHYDSITLRRQPVPRPVARARTAGSAVAENGGSTSVSNDDSATSASPQFQAAIALAGLEHIQWQAVSSTEYRAPNPSGIRAVEDAFRADTVDQIRSVQDVLAASDPASAKRFLRSAAAGIPLGVNLPSQLSGSVRGLQRGGAAALCAKSIAAACRWPFLGSRTRVQADFDAAHFQRRHIEACSRCQRAPGRTVLKDGTVVVVSPQCWCFDMTMRAFCGCEVPIGHLAQRWRDAVGPTAPDLSCTSAWQDLPPRHSANRSSVRVHASAMDKKWKEELRLGWLRQVPACELHSIAPALAVVRPSEQRAANRVGRLPKARICSDLSHGSPSINDLTPHWPFRLVKMRRVIAKLRRGWLMGVNDVSSAYRRFAWNTDMLRYTGLKWRGTTVADTRLTFGSSAAPAMCQFYTQSVVETITRRAVSELGLAAGDFFVHVYLDDVIHAASSEGACVSLARLVEEEFVAHGLHLKAAKSQGPALSSVVYLGWRLCSETETMALTSEKTRDLRRSCQQLMRSRGVRSRPLRSLAGKLAWAAAAMPGATCRLQALWRDISRRKGRDDPRALSTSARQTLEWFVGAFRGTVAVQCHFKDWTQSVIVITDAAGELRDSHQAGFGALVIGPSEIRLFQQAWSDEERALFKSSKQDSSVLREALAAYLAAKRSQDMWSPPRPETGRGLPVLFITDSLAGACAILKGSSSRSPVPSPLNRSLLNDLMLDMADLFAAARSDYAAWWVRRDQLAGVDWLSRTNLRSAEDAAAAGSDAASWHRAARCDRDGRPTRAHHSTRGGSRFPTPARPAAPSCAGRGNISGQTQCSGSLVTVSAGEGETSGDSERSSRHRSGDASFGESIDSQRRYRDPGLRTCASPLRSRRHVPRVAGDVRVAPLLCDRLRHGAGAEQSGSSHGAGRSKAVREQDHYSLASGVQGRNNNKGTADGPESVDKRTGGRTRPVPDPARLSVHASHSSTAAPVVREPPRSKRLALEVADVHRSAGVMSAGSSDTQRGRWIAFRGHRLDTRRQSGGGSAESAQKQGVRRQRTDSFAGNRRQHERAGLAEAVHVCPVRADTSVDDVAPPQSSCLPAAAASRPVGALVGIEDDGADEASVPGRRRTGHHRDPPVTSQRPSRLCFGGDSTAVSAGSHSAVYWTPGCQKLARLLTRACRDPAGMATENVPPLRRQWHGQRVVR